MEQEMAAKARGAWHGTGNGWEHGMEQEMAAEHTLTIQRIKAKITAAMMPRTKSQRSATSKTYTLATAQTTMVTM